MNRQQKSNLTSYLIGSRFKMKQAIRLENNITEMYLFNHRVGTTIKVACKPNPNYREYRLKERENPVKIVQKMGIKI